MFCNIQKPFIIILKKRLEFFSQDWDKDFVQDVIRIRVNSNGYQTVNNQLNSSFNIKFLTTRSGMITVLQLIVLRYFGNHYGAN